VWLQKIVVLSTKVCGYPEYYVRLREFVGSSRNIFASPKKLDAPPKYLAPVQQIFGAPKKFGTLTKKLCSCRENFDVFSKNVVCLQYVVRHRKIGPRWRKFFEVTSSSLLQKNVRVSRKFCAPRKIECVSQTIVNVCRKLSISAKKLYSHPKSWSVSRKYSAVPKKVSLTKRIIRMYRKHCALPKNFDVSQKVVRVVKILYTSQKIVRDSSKFCAAPKKLWACTENFVKFPKIVPGTRKFSTPPKNVNLSRKNYSAL
jgi:hypothetical protein